MMAPPDNPTPILVSACLLGVDCRYNGRIKHNQAVLDYLTRRGLIAVPVCPEQLAGLPTPREATRFLRGDGAEVLAGRGEVVSHSGIPHTRQFIKGAEQAAHIARLAGCTSALLKERSPSCAVRQIDCNGQRVAGMGVTTARLLAAGLTVFSEDDVSE